MMMTRLLLSSGVRPTTHIPARMATFDELWAAYATDRWPDNIGDALDGVLLGELDDEVQDVASTYAALGPELEAWRVARLGLALKGITQALPQLEPRATREYFERLATLAQVVLGEIAERGA